MDNEPAAAQAQQNVLEVKHLNKEFYSKRTGKKLKAVNDISFTLKQGEMLSLIGKSGCGKSTLLRMLAGLLDADSGEVHYKGQPVSGPSQNLVPGHPDIKLVYQDYQLFPHMTLRENIAHVLLRYRPEWKAQRIAELLEITQLREFEDNFPAELSGGQQQRLALAMAIASGPELLLLDEPFGSLDAYMRNRIIARVIDKLKGEGVTIVLVTHDTRDGLALSDKIGIVEKGSMVQLGTPWQVYRHPVSPYVAAFFGEANNLPAAFLQILPEAVRRQVMEANPGVKPKSGNHAVSIRPESMKLRKDVDGHFVLQVRKVRYMGSHWQVEGVTPENFRLILYTEEQPGQGEEYGVTVKPAEVHVFEP